jgi:hypothetical protein
MTKSKVCKWCNKRKPTSAFYKHRETNDKLFAHCKKCQADRQRELHKIPGSRLRYREYNKTFIKRRVEFLYEYLSRHPCIDCGESDPIVLTFDHVKGKKVDNVSVLKLQAMSRLKIEIKKCVVRCFNCHTRKTAKTHGWYKGAIKSSK